MSITEPEEQILRVRKATRDECQRGAKITHGETDIDMPAAPCEIHNPRRRRGRRIDEGRGRDRLGEAADYE
jgi:hypothetical protein